MAESCDILHLRQEWHQLLLKLKSTVEGLLATPTTNVWNTYGGLNRLCQNVEQILNHGLKVTQGHHGSSLDYWNFVCGLRWMNPTLAPVMDALDRKGIERPSAGQEWVRQSLLNHTLSSQLHVLTSNRQHLADNYTGESFLCQKEYLQAMLICLQAVEQNKAAILAEVNPNLLLGRRKPVRTRQKISHVRSASLPVFNQHSDSIMIRRTRTQDRLAPPFTSPKTESALSLSPEVAKASLESSPESAKDALLSVLNKAGDMDFDFGEDTLHTFQHPTKTLPPDPLQMLDPLQGLDIYRNTDMRVLASRGLYNVGYTIEEQTVNNENSTKSDRILGLSTKMDMDAEEVSEEADLLVQKRTGTQNRKYSLDSRTKHEDDPFKQQHDPLLSPDTSSRDNEPQSAKTSQPHSLSCDSGLSTLPTRLESTRQKGSVKSAQSSKKLTHYRSMSDYGLPHKAIREDVSSESKTSESTHLSSSLPTHQKDDGSHETFFPKPEEGQSLMSFLSSQDFHTCAELDKENAHFSISEALIAAIEQMKWNQVLRPQLESDHEPDSDEEIQELKQRIRIRRRERLKEKARGFPAFSDGKTDTNTTTTSVSESLSSSSQQELFTSSDSSTGSSEEIHDTEITDADGSTSGSNLTSLKETGLSLSMASMYSEVELQKSNLAVSEKSTERSSSSDYGHLTLISAESVAISLMKQFSEKHLPKASDLQWLVSEQDAPQALLPLPTSYPVSPDEGENADLNKFNKRTRIRGNLEWAPPRPQIIFNIHPPPKRKIVLAKQNYRCAGCGAKVEPGYMKRYRYCEYLGKYFCPRCHSNQYAYIPGRILRKWDFTKYSVSNFAYELLKKINGDPLFNLEDINSTLYRKVKILDQMNDSREQLKHLQVFLQTCRNGASMLEKYKRLPSHWISDVHSYSIKELCLLKKLELLPEIRSVVNDSVTHVSQCQLCQAKAFICELCNNDHDFLFPFELGRVTQCPACKTCFHRSCYIPEKCPKCARIESRRQQIQNTFVLSEDEDDSSR